MATSRTRLLDAALNAATLARNSVGNTNIGKTVGLTSDDLKNAREILKGLSQDALTSVFDRRDFVVTNGWRPAGV